jgi:asparagine synthase (glutamine-hydrolysing)
VKHPYRAPIHRSFFSPKPLDFVSDLLSESAIQASGLFEPRAVQMVYQKARNGAAMSEVEDMALVGILSAQLVDQQFVRGAVARPARLTPGLIKKIDRMTIPS